jgi:hypothetical protein
VDNTQQIGIRAVLRQDSVTSNKRRKDTGDVEDTQDEYPAAIGGAKLDKPVSRDAARFWRPYLEVALILNYFYYRLGSIYHVM